MWKHIPSPAIGGVWWCPPFFLSPGLLCVLLFGRRAVLLAFHHLSPSESSSAYRAFFTLPTTRQGSPHPGGLGEKGHHLWLLCGWCWGCFLGWSVQEPPCAIQRQIKGFSCSFGKARTSSISYVPASYEVSRSVTGSREGRQFGFCFPAVSFWNCIELLAEQECIWCGGHSCCIHRNPGGRKPMTCKPLW